MLQDQEATTTTANETLSAIDGDVYDAALPASTGDDNYPKGKTTEKRSRSTSSVSKQAGGKFSHIPQRSYVYFL